jgi:hypothetical protein
MTPLRFFFVVALAFAPFQQHPEPAKDFFCRQPAKDVDKDHVCTCKAVCDPATHERVEDVKCRVFCHPLHCACPDPCCPGPR